MKYYFVAGEKSGDLHAGNLIKALKKYDSQPVMRGFGGDDMQAEGVTLRVHYRDMALMGFLSLATKLFSIFKYIAICKKDILEFQPDVIVLVDYGGFNMKIARFGKENNIKVFYYITPKVWAWYQSRAIKLKNTVDRMFVILPFEKDFYKKYNWDVDYVGNPVLDAIKDFAPQKEFKEKICGKDNGAVVALLPGSRAVELKRMVPLMAGVVKKNSTVRFIVAAVANMPQSLYSDLRDLPNVKFVEEASYDLLQIADAAIVTSGTATLETGIFRVPQVVVYKMGSLEYALVSRLVKVQFISLVNLIAGKAVIREMIQKDANVEDVNAELNRLLSDQSYRSTMKDEYEKIYKLLDTGSASDNTARLMTKYLSENKSA